MTIKKITNNIFKINNDSNIYYIKDQNLIIDAGNSMFKQEIIEDLKETCDTNSIKAVILTHLHYDHIGCFDLFPGAKFYVSSLAIKEFENNKMSYILDPILAYKFNVKLYNIDNLKLPNNYEIILTPGHCKSSICIYEKKEKILFSGDTLFLGDVYGRYDLPTSNIKELKISLNKLKKINYEILCPGHDY